jgi:sec-independent protein translocase protein TatA
MLRGALEPWHVIIIVALLFVLFGAKRMPDASRSLARSMKIFKNEVKDLRDDDDDTVTPEIAATPVVRAPVAGGATAVTPAPVVTAPVSTSAAADEVALREAELRLAEAKVNELRARAAARSEHERV